ncbi:MAG: pantoate--beta-alanine ligase [Gammaproteobacteria bacterium]|nr:pantoate--beta-alanine ligase [Gammaproteobacteria bacterium]
MDAVSEVGALRSLLSARREAGERIVLVPTMGNLHEGHLALVKRARESGDCVVATIFVNPFQFGENEDFDTYPRTLDADLEALEDYRCDVVFMPTERLVYPQGPERVTRVEVPELGSILCGQQRPGFFRGVATVVNILLNMVEPHAAVFGEKDYQQLLIIRRMVGDLHMDVEIIMVETIREPDGLAMSSRNSYLTPEERKRASTLFKALELARRSVREGDRDFYAIGMRGIEALSGAGFRPEYFAIRRAGDLMIPGPEDRELRVLAAAWLGAARLIDNVAV